MSSLPSKNPSDGSEPGQSDRGRKKNLTENGYCSQKTYVNLNSECRRQSTNIGSFKNKNPHLRMKIVNLVVYLPPLSSVLKNV